MPEMRFIVRWPDESVTSCYSPSLVVREYLDVGATYPLTDFLERVHTALDIGSQRVREKFGFACSLAEAERARIDRKAAPFAAHPESSVTIEAFEPEEAR